MEGCVWLLQPSRPEKCLLCWSPKSKCLHLHEDFVWRCFLNPQICYIYFLEPAQKYALSTWTFWTFTIAATDPSPETKKVCTIGRKPMCWLALGNLTWTPMNTQHSPNSCRPLPARGAVTGNAPCVHWMRVLQLLKWQPSASPDAAWMWHWDCQMASYILPCDLKFWTAASDFHSSFDAIPTYVHTLNWRWAVQTGVTFLLFLQAQSGCEKWLP